MENQRNFITASIHVKRIGAESYRKPLGVLPLTYMPRIGEHIAVMLDESERLTKVQEIIHGAGSRGAGSHGAGSHGAGKNHPPAPNLEIFVEEVGATGIFYPERPESPV